MAGEIARRTFLAGAGGLGLLALVPGHRLRALATGAPGVGQPGRFLSAHELDTLRAVTARLVPGRAEGEPDPGAVEAGCAEAIDLLLGAFAVNPPLIHAGGPYSGRAPVGGIGVHDDFADFVALDPQAELGWRIRLEGSLGRPEREFAGPVVGLQSVYRGGLAHLDARAVAMGSSSFLSMPPPEQDLVLSDPTDSETQAFVGTAMANTLEALYGPPEYGGNRGLVGWRTTGWDGDVQPRGYTPTQVSELDAKPRNPPLGGDSALGPAAAAAAREALARFLPALRGRAASQAASWLGRPGYERG
ncbi:MAG: gluconate 2-dehydrogenase subunit 3 family protein [Acidimicrobiales bacterium]